MIDLEKELAQVIDRAIIEDVREGDITSLACLPKESQTSGLFLLKQSGMVAGLPLLPLIFNNPEQQPEISLLVQEGSFQKAGTPIAQVKGPATLILERERVALNFLQHACGVATITANFVKKIQGLKCDILDTRKTLPGLRAFEKYAVAVGGGKNHRNSLDECFLIKSSHLSFLEGSDRHPIEEAVSRVRALNPTMPIEIQIDQLSSIEEAVKHDFRTIMLRNMALSELQECLFIIRSVNKKVYVAFTGNVTLETVRALAETGLNGISVSALTHSVQGIDIGMRLK